MAYNVNGKSKENITSYPVVEVRSSLASELIVEVFEDEDGNVTRVNVVVDSRELLTRLKHSLSASPAPYTFQKPNLSSEIHPFVSSPFKEFYDDEVSANNGLFLLSHNAAKVLSGLLGDKNGKVRSTAVKSLQSSPVDFALDSGIVKMIFKSLNDPDGEVRENTVVTLGKLGAIYVAHCWNTEYGRFAKNTKKDK